MKKQRTKLNYNNEPLKEDEVLVMMPYDKLFAKANVTNPDSLVTASIMGYKVPAILMAVPKEFAQTARASFNSWARDQHPPFNKGRCLIENDDGSKSQCPRHKPGDERPCCDDCPYNGILERADASRLSIDQMIDEHDFCPIPGGINPEDKIVERETMTESLRLIRSKLEGLLVKEPKIAYALFLTALGVDGAEFSNRMRLTPNAAYVIRQSIEALVADHVSSFAELDFSRLHARHSKYDQYYLIEARKLLDVLIDILNGNASF